MIKLADILNEIKIIKPGDQPADIIIPSELFNFRDSFNGPKIFKILEKYRSNFPEIDDKKYATFVDCYVDELYDNGDVDAYRNETINQILWDFKTYIENY